jgi:RimJ/RimL family protein N-acetyltransferase
MHAMPFPVELHTARLLLRPWRAADAAELLPILEANRAHIGPWIPKRVAEPVPVPQLAERLDGFAEVFRADREWRFAMVAVDDGRILGEAGLFPRDASGRVAFSESDRVELGYWLRSDATGRGFVIEAARALLDAASTIKQFSCAEIRCDPRNAPSVAVARRLGFELAEETDEPLQTWVRRPVSS